VTPPEGPVASRRSALGRGLGALIPGASAAPRAAVDATAASAGAGPIPVGEIRANPEQPRRRFDPAELERLAESIRRHGVIQPVVVRRAETGYELVVGERRWRAAQQAGLTTIPAVVADVAAPARLELALVENVQRHGLNPIELAQAFRTLAERGATHEEIGARVGFDRVTVTNHLRLLDLPREFQSDVEEGALTMGHAKALLSVTQPERRRALRDRIVREGLSVRRSEEEARELGAAVRPPRRTRAAGSTLDPDAARLVDLLRGRLRTQVRLRGTPARGRIEIEYFGAEELNRLAELILGAGREAPGLFNREDR
jgi:ParB family chromosome partitioning protein